MTVPPPPGGAAAGLAATSERAIAAFLAHHPVEATYLGDHSHDDELDDPSAGAARARAAELRALSAELDALPGAGPDDDLDDDDVDAAVLRTVIAAELFELDVLREAEWNPMLHNPGGGLHALLSRDFAPLPDRLAAAERRLAAVPDYLRAARERLGVMTAIHLDTALTQLDGTLDLVDDAVRLAGGGSRFVATADAAATAIREHQDALRSDRDDAVRDPRIGADAFAAGLALTLDTALDPERLLARAEADLDRLHAEIVDHAGRVAGTGRPDATTVREVLDRSARSAPTDATVLDACRDALATTTAFVRDHDLVTVFDDPVAVVAMPEIDRGVAVAYCRPNGPLEPADLPTEFAVSPTPAGWTTDQVASFYREYNADMIADLTVHEAMPGHALQLMHAQRHRARTRVRRVWWSGSFVEGWAVYAEELMARHGYPGRFPDGAAAAVRMQQLKMQLRTTLNAILDIRFHCDGLGEAEALDLMRERGFQESGEAIGKWRRVQLSSTQLCTYYVGYTEVAAVARDLGRLRPDLSLRQVHDAMLAHGSPPARHLRTLLGLPPTDG